MATATTTGVVLTQGGAKKLKAMSDAFDQRRRQQGGKSNPAGPQESGFWALLTGCDLSGRRYSFIRVALDASQDDPDVILDGGQLQWRILQDDTPHLACAYELNGAIGLSMKIVKMEFFGYRPAPAPATGQVAVFAFAFEQMDANVALPIHDHRSNAPQDGGFAFSVWHPGTQLPANANFP